MAQSLLLLMPRVCSRMPTTCIMTLLGRHFVLCHFRNQALLGYFLTAPMFASYMRPSLAPSVSNTLFVGSMRVI